MPILRGGVEKSLPARNDARQRERPLKTVPIDNGNRVAAVALLTKGFPEKSEAFWALGVSLISDHHQRQDLGPIGQLLMKGDDAVGVLLTIRSRLPETGRTVVNLSSWYVEPSSRWFAPRMLQMATSSDEDIFTDLTPSPEACKLNERLGFTTVTNCTLFYPLPLKAFGPAPGRGCARLPKCRRARCLPPRATCWKIMRVSAASLRSWRRMAAIIRWCF
ncbi:hypothetical protein [Rhizobium sp. AN69]|uniref:hypothetical protein n=1 Tax=Rhizobium sp. AN69 TaxID=3035213 RepID=UPI002B2624A5|nr:hypothetical protein [Rhizobium sp. AN69]